MTLRSLEIFLAVLESGSMSAAARTLYISQPSVSNVIADLEKEYQTKLFDRLNHKLYVTPDGERLASYARTMLSLDSELTRQMLGKNHMTQLRIGATVTVGTCILLDILKEYQGPTPYVLVNNTKIIESRLLDGSLDLALVEGTIHSSELISQPFCQDQLTFVCHPSHPLAKKKELRFSDVQGESFVLREAGSGTRELFSQAMSNAGYSLRPIWECNNTAALLEAVRNEIGATVISKRFVENDPTLVSIPFQNHQLRRSFSLILHKDKYISPQMQALIQLLH